MSSKSLIVSIAKQKCPKCREGNMFKEHPYNLNAFDKMHKSCPNCGTSLDLEPGFYMGAMYVSYALQIALFITVFATTQLLYPEAGIVWYLSWIGGMVLLLFPLTFRLSRSIWLHIFVPFDIQRKKSLKKA